jgi:hypothetical protein
MRTILKILFTALNISVASAHFGLSPSLINRGFNHGSNAATTDHLIGRVEGRSSRPLNLLMLKGGYQEADDILSSDIGSMSSSLALLKLGLQVIIATTSY